MASKLRPTDNKSKIVIFLLLVYFSTLTPIVPVSGALSDGTCLGHEALNVLRHSPGGFNPEVGIDGKECASLCSDFSMPLAGVVGKKYCLCAHEVDRAAMEAVPTVASDLCDGDELYVRFFGGSIIYPIEGLKVTAGSVDAFVDDVVTFDVSFEKGVQVQFLVDFGDGTPPTEWKDKKKWEHTFRLAGQFNVKVRARQPGKPERQLAAASTEVNIVEKVLEVEREVAFTCLDIIEPGDQPGCNLTLYSGQDLNIQVDFGDGTEPLFYNSSDVTGKSIGPYIPTEFKSKSSVEEEAFTFIVSASQSVVDRDATIRAVEGYGEDAGDMELQIYRPHCGDDSCPLPGNALTCPEGLVLCLKSKTCVEMTEGTQASVDNELPVVCRPSSTGPQFADYKLMRRVKLTILNGYFFLRLSKARNILPGDLIVLKSRGGTLMARPTLENEDPDWKLDDGQPEEPNKYINSGQIVSLDNIKFLIKILIYEDLKVSLPHDYTNSSEFQINLNINSPWFETEYVQTHPITVQSSINKVRLRVIPPNAAIGQKVDVIMMLNSGSDVNLMWDFGDGEREEALIDVVRSSTEKFFRSHNYSEPGSYPIKVRAHNLQSDVGGAHVLIAEYPVTMDWLLSSDSPQLLPGSVRFVLSYPEEASLPTNATGEIFFGDGTTERWAVPMTEGLPDGERVFEHVYSKSGKYKVMFTLSNLVSSLTLKTEAYLLRQINGFKVDVGLKGRRPKDGLTPGYGVSNNRYPANKAIGFKFSTETGDIEKYIVEMNGTLLKETTNHDFVYSDPEPGWHNFTFCAFNDIQNRTPPVEVNLYMMEVVKGLHVVDLSNITEPNNKYFEVTLEEIGTDTCLLVDFGDPLSDDPTLMDAYGDEATCREVFGGRRFKLTGDLVSPLELNHMYPVPGNYVVTFRAGNHVPDALTLELPLTVIEIDCRPPQVEIKNRADDYLNGTEFWRSKPVQLYAKTLVDCNATTIVTRVWEGFRLDPNTGEVEEKIDLSPIDSYRKTFLYVPPFFLQKGVYKFRFSINLASPESHPLLPFYEFADTHVNIVPSPIMGQMSDGAQSRVIRGWGQTLRLAPGNFSIDPDDATNKDFNVTWFCRRLPGEQIERDLADFEQAISDPIYDRDSYDMSQEDLGGCFGKGPGMVNITSGWIEWNTKVFYKPALIYEIVVRLSPPDRLPSWSGIQLVLLERSPPSIKVKCQTPALCYPHDPIGQKINPVRVGLIGICSEDCDGELTYEWTIFGMDEKKQEVLLQDAHEYVVGADEEKMALGKEFFDRYYPMFRDFFAKLAVSNELGDRGESDIFLHINQPPEQGECTFSLSEGEMALLDKFYISCKGWLDPEEKPIEYYAFWIRNLNNGIVSFLMYGPDKEAELVLPYGNFTVGVDIKDKEGSLTRLNITDITTKAPTKQEFDAFMSTKQLENADAAGDQAKMNMVSQAVSSLISIDLFDAEAEADEEQYQLEMTTMASVNGTYNTTHAELWDAKAKAKKERAEEESAKTRAKMVKSVDSIMNVDTLNSLEQVGSVLTAIAGKGNGVDNEAKEIVIKLLNKTVNLASTIEVESPQQLLDFCMYAVGTMGGIVNRMSQQIVTGKVLPTDRAKAWEIEYSVEVPDYGEKPDYIFDGKSSVEESLNKAVVDHERRAAEGQIRQMIDLTIELVLAMLRNIVVGEKPLEFAAPSGLSLTISMFNGGGISNKSIKHGDAVYVFPEVCAILDNILPNCTGNETLGIMAVSWPAILESYGNSVDLLSTDTKTLQLMMLSEDLRLMDVSNTSELFGIIVPRKGEGEGDEEGKGEALPEANFIEPEMKWYEQMVYHQIAIEKADSAVNIEITPGNPEAELLLFFNYNYKPLADHYELLIPLRAVRDKMVNGTYDIFLGNDIINNRTGFFYLGVAEVNATEVAASPEAYLLDEMIVNPNASLTNFTLIESNYTLPGLIREFTTNYSLRLFTSGCYFFDYTKKIWSGDGCYVLTANQALTHCKCNHLTSFGSGFFVMPNTVDFSYVFANAGFADNITIYMTIIISLSLYVFLMTWARVKDKEDLTKLGATPLPDNEPLDKYLYEITVFTGDKEGAGTDSKVSLILSGDDDETDVRTLSDPKRKIFRRGGSDIFVMATPHRLGRLNYARIWHDNSGNGKFRSWFMSYIVVRDIQNGEKFEFINNKWLAVERGDGCVDRLLPVAGRGEATEFSHLFEQKTQKNLKDGHLWFSVFMRPPQSRFTRVQRVSCCMALLYLSMLVNAMWYERVPPKPKGSALEIGPFSLSPEQIGVGFFANLIVFPPTFLIVLFFRKSRLRKLRPSRIQEALERQGVEVKKPGGRKKNLTTSTTTLIEVDHLPREFLAEPKKRASLGLKKKKKKKSFLLPWWCRYIGWALCILSMLVSIFFLWAYGIQFGDEKTRKWVTSLIVSFFTSILITQPVKVFLTAMVLSTLFKSPDADTDDAEEDEEEIDLELAPDEEWLHSLAGITPTRRPKGRGRSKLYRPPNLTALEKAKLERLKEIKMGLILKEIWSYLFFLWILIVLSYGNRDPNAFLMKDTLKSTFIDGANSGESFESVKTTRDLWSWINSTLIPELLVGPWYNGHQPYGLRGFLNDRVNRMMGFGVLRQVRIKESTCSLNARMKSALSPGSRMCRKFANMIHEDRRNYAKGWKPLGAGTSGPGAGDFSAYNETEPENEPIEEGTVTRIAGEEDLVILNPSKSKKNEWHYRRPSELDGLPFWGKLDMYSGGGYLLALKGSRGQLQKTLAGMARNQWVDARTRAVFAEFSMYNAQVNLFAVVTIVAEYQPGGGVVPNYRIDVVRLIRYHQGFGLFIIMCELTYVGFILYFTVREIKRWRQDGRDYLKSYWNWAEMFVISFSYAAMVLYVYRTILTHRILKIFDKTHGNGYIKLQYVTSIDESFGYIIAFTIFIGILKFIRLLRFNKRMGVLYSTLAQCSKDLKSFCIVFLIVFFAFVQMFYLLFGLHIKDFSTLTNSAESAFGMMTGKFNFDAMCMASPLLGPFAFFVFVLIASIVLLNIFLTLIISAFETVKHDLQKQSNEYEIMDFIMRKAKGLLGIESDNSGAAALRDQIEREEGINTIEEQLNSFPDKVDQLMHHINDVYFGGRLEVGSHSDSRSRRTSLGPGSAATRRMGSSGASRALLENVAITHLERSMGSEILSNNALQTQSYHYYKRRASRAGRRANRRKSNETVASLSELSLNPGHEAPQIALLDWMEVKDDTEDATVRRGPSNGSRDRTRSRGRGSDRDGEQETALREIGKKY